MNGRLAQLERLYETDHGDTAFATVVGSLDDRDDTVLADLIEADGRARIRRNMTVELERYLVTVPDLTDRADPLDAAIDMTLRSLSRTGRPDREAVETLITRHPSLASAIRDAAALNSVVWSTNRLRADFEPPPGRALPCDFGPLMPGGAHRYELQELLGEGAFGQVYLAKDRQLSETEHDAMVSIKVLSPRADDGVWGRQRFIEEATKARRIEHANVVRVLDRGVSDQDEDFIVYEFIDGGDLGRWLPARDTSLSPEEAARLVADVARGLHAAHMAGLVHCDLKPGNIVMTRGGEPRIADFGIAIRTADGEARREASGLAPLGNLAFIAPEQFRMEDGALTFPSDIYALGGVLYWLLVDELPNGDTADAIALTHDPARGRREPPSPRSRRPDIDDDLDAICRRALEPRPEDRFASAADLAESLEAWLRREPLLWRKPSVPRRARLWARRKPAQAVMLASLVVVSVAGGITLFQAAVARQARQNARATIASQVRKIEAARNDKIVTDLLPQLWLMEWVYAETFLADMADWTEAWRQRQEIVGQIVNERRATGHIDDFETLLWESALGFWLVNDAQFERAREVLAANRASWAGKLAAEDPWLAQLDAMSACAMIGLVADGVVPFGADAVAEAEQTLTRVATTMTPHHFGTPIHHMILQHQLMLYGPRVLDDPERHAALHAEFDVVFPPPRERKGGSGGSGSQ